RHAHRALSVLTRVADLDARNHAYGSAANAATQLRQPEVALLYQNAAVTDLQRAVNAVPGDKNAKIQLSVAFRKRAEILVQLEQDDNAEKDLQQTADLAEAADVR